MVVVGEIRRGVARAAASLSTPGRSPSERMAVDDTPEPPQTGPRAGDVAALLEAGRKSEACVALRSLLAQRPNDHGVRRHLIALLIEDGQYRDALLEIESGLQVIGNDSWLLQRKLRVKMRLGDLSGAIRSWNEAAAAAERVQDLEVLLETMRSLFLRWQHPLALHGLLQHLRRVSEAYPEGDGSPAASLGMRLLLALRDYRGFLNRFDAAPLQVGEPWSARLTQAAAILRRSKIPDFEAEKVFCIGLSKTGTMSLAEALRSMGYLTAHYANIFSLQMLIEDDAFIFDAMCDTPVCLRFETLYHMFPNAKFIYTRRSYGEWLPSFEKHCMRGYGTTDFEVIRRIPIERKALPSISDFESVDCSLYFRHANAGLAYHAYDARVRNFFRNKPAPKLLEYNVFAGHGWAELCGFLNRPVPAADYPWENRSN